MDARARVRVCVNLRQEAQIWIVIPAPLLREAR